MVCKDQLDLTSTPQIGIYLFITEVLTKISHKTLYTKVKLTEILKTTDPSFHNDALYREVNDTSDNLPPPTITHQRGLITPTPYTIAEKLTN